MITGSVSSTSLIRTADAEALGTMTNMMDTIMNENMICMAYCRNAIRSPTAMLPLSIRMPPYHIIAMEDTFRTSIIVGIIAAMTLFTLIEVSVRSKLAFSNRFASCSVRLNERMTRIPVNPSRRTRFKRSILF
ncbi:hypothetical protein D3C81_1319390 [compost metagenome]